MMSGHVNRRRFMQFAALTAGLAASPGGLDNRKEITHV